MQSCQATPGDYRDLCVTTSEFTNPPIVFNLQQGFFPHTNARSRLRTRVRLHKNPLSTSTRVRAHGVIVPFGDTSPVCLCVPQLVHHTRPSPVPPHDLGAGHSACKFVYGPLDVQWKLSSIAAILWLLLPHLKIFPQGSNDGGARGHAPGGAVQLGAL